MTKICAVAIPSEEVFKKEGLSLNIKERVVLFEILRASNFTFGIFVEFKPLKEACVPLKVSKIIKSLSDKGVVEIMKN